MDSTNYPGDAHGEPDALTLDESVVADFAALGSPEDDVLAELIDVFAEDADEQADAIAALRAYHARLNAR